MDAMIETKPWHYPTFCSRSCCTVSSVEPSFCRTAFLLNPARQGVGEGKRRQGDVGRNQAERPVPNLVDSLLSSVVTVPLYMSDNICRYIYFPDLY